jgi:catechol 2,3-dioxygenase-like lactoylglutathione lyase family enzyme
MPGPQPQFDQVNLVTEDLEATLTFYRRLGVTIPDGSSDWPLGSGARHVDVSTPSGMHLEFDNLAMANIWHAGLRSGPNGAPATVLGFSLPSREAVDAQHALLTEAGYASRQLPYDAFWGARYAIVQDPDGRDVGLMSPIDPERRYTPTP